MLQDLVDFGKGNADAQNKNLEALLTNANGGEREVYVAGALAKEILSQRLSRKRK